MKELARFFKTQTNVEIVMMFYFFTLLVYVVSVFIIKYKHRNSIGIFMLKNKGLLCKITYVILCAYMVAGCTVYKIVDNILVYFGVMSAAVIVVNYLCILNYNISKYKGIEFTTVEQDILEIASYCKINDNILAFMNDFISYIGCQEEDEINDLDFAAFGKHWLSILQEYIKDRIQDIDYNILPDDKKSLYSFVKNKCVLEGLWYNDSSIYRFVDLILNGEEAILTHNIRIVPIYSKRFECYIYVKGKKELKDIDISFLIDTFKIMSLL